MTAPSHSPAAAAADGPQKDVVHPQTAAGMTDRVGSLGRQAETADEPHGDFRDPQNAALEVLPRRDNGAHVDNPRKRPRDSLTGTNKGTGPGRQVRPGAAASLAAAYTSLVHGTGPGLSSMAAPGRTPMSLPRHDRESVVMPAAASGAAIRPHHAHQKPASEQAMRSMPLLPTQADQEFASHAAIPIPMPKEAKPSEERAGRQAVHDPGTNPDEGIQGPAASTAAAAYTSLVHSQPKLMSAEMHRGSSFQAADQESCRPDPDTACGLDPDQSPRISGLLNAEQRSEAATNLLRRDVHPGLSPDLLQDGSVLSEPHGLDGSGHVSATNDRLACLRVVSAANEPAEPPSREESAEAHEASHEPPSWAMPVAAADMHGGHQQSDTSNTGEPRVPPGCSAPSSLAKPQRGALSSSSSTPSHRKVPQR